MTIRLPDLAYSMDALAPVISAETMNTHWGKHHRGYVDKVNVLASAAGLEGCTLDEIIARATGPLQNFAAQAFNHALLWRSMTPETTEPSAELTAAIESAFGSKGELLKNLASDAKTLFGSGWVWLVARPGAATSLEIMSTSNAGLRVHEERVIPLLTCDVWEHAYYLDHKNDRGAYVDGFCNLIDWSAASERFASLAGAPHHQNQAAKELQ